MFRPLRIASAALALLGGVTFSTIADDSTEALLAVLGGALVVVSVVLAAFDAIDQHAARGAR